MLRDNFKWFKVNTIGFSKRGMEDDKKIMMKFDKSYKSAVLSFNKPQTSKIRRKLCQGQTRQTAYIQSLISGLVYYVAIEN